MQFSGNGDAVAAPDRSADVAWQAGAAALAGALPGRANGTEQQDRDRRSDSGRRNTSPASPGRRSSTRPPNARRWCRSNYSGRLTYWYVGPNQASPQIEHDIDAAVLGGLRQDLSEHQGRRHRISTTTRCSTSCARRRWAMRRRWWPGCRSCGASNSRPRASCMSSRPPDVGYAERASSGRAR